MVCIAGPAPPQQTPRQSMSCLFARPLRVTRARDEGLYLGATQGREVTDVRSPYTWGELEA